MALKRRFLRTIRGTYITPWKRDFSHIGIKCNPKNKKLVIIGNNSRIGDVCNI